MNKNKQEQQILTKEEKREVRFLSSLEEFKARGFRAKEYSISIRTINIVIFMFGVISGATLGVFNVNFFSIRSLVIAVVIIPVIIVLHELLHAIGFTIRKNIEWKDNIIFGIRLEKMVAYCHCLRPVLVIDYFIALMLPFAVLGFGLFVVGMVVKSNLLIFASVFNLFSCVGDLIMACCLLFCKKPSFILDKPKGIGYIALYQKKDNG
jgi:hypothetical protein